MPAATTMPPTFSGEELTKLLALIKDSDSVELKLTVPETDQRSAVVTLGLDPLEAQIRQIFFFDTPDLALDKQGVVVRARRIQGRGTTPRSSSARSFQRSCRTSCAARPPFASRSTRCPAATSARVP